MAPSALVRSVPSLKIVVTSDSAAGTIAAAPMPWTKRATTSAVESLANPAVLDGHVEVVSDRREGRVHDRPIGPSAKSGNGTKQSRSKVRFPRVEDRNEVASVARVGTSLN